MDAQCSLSRGPSDLQPNTAARGEAGEGRGMVLPIVPAEPVGVTAHQPAELGFILSKDSRDGPALRTGCSRAGRIFSSSCCGHFSSEENELFKLLNPKILPLWDEPRSPGDTGREADPSPLGLEEGWCSL